MRYLLAPDSFKEAASAQTVAEAMRKGVMAGDPNAECRLMPLSDGGEGLASALVQAAGGTMRSVRTTDALGRPITAQYGFLGSIGRRSDISNRTKDSDATVSDRAKASSNGDSPDIGSPDGDSQNGDFLDCGNSFESGRPDNHSISAGSPTVRTAVIELASASGLEAIAPADRDPMAASTYGTGLLIRDAINAGAGRIVLGLGGSATTDGGTGLARALGYRFLDEYGRELPFGGGANINMAAIDDSNVSDEVRATPIILACDVTNPLTGPQGAAYVFAPQKGADSHQVKLLDQGLAKFADVIADYRRRVIDLNDSHETGSAAETLRGTSHRIPIDIRNVPGAGAAGGTGGGLLGLFNARIEPGIDLVLNLLHAREACAWADVVITGEGSIDAQTPYGKVPSGIARLAKSQGKPAIAVGGKVAHDPQTIAALREAGIVATFGVTPGPASLPELLAGTERNVESTCAAIAGLLRMTQNG